MVYGPWSIMSHAWLTENPPSTIRPKGGTLTAAGGASPEARDNPSPLEYRVYAEHRQFTEQCSRFVSRNCSA